jgi:hypothetical protein
MRKSSMSCMDNILIDHTVAARLWLDPTGHQGCVAAVDCEDGIAPTIHAVRNQCTSKAFLSSLYAPIALIDGAAARSLPHSFLSRNRKTGIRIHSLKIDRLRSKSRNGEGNGGKDGHEKVDESHIDFERGCSCTDSQLRGC